MKPPLAVWNTTHIAKVASYTAKDKDEPDVEVLKDLPHGRKHIAEKTQMEPGVSNPNYFYYLFRKISARR